MALSEVIDTVFRSLGERGYQARLVSIDHLSSLRDEIEGRVKQGLLDSDFYKTRLASFKFVPPEDLVAKSLVVVAVPRPQTQATFRWKGKALPLILPPTYTAYDQITKAVRDMISELIGGKGFKTAPTALPLKALAVRSGLARYGRNNITYVPGMGSFLQLVAVYTDLPPEKATWQDPEMMKACEKCQRCREACPTGAIPSDRFLLRAERCIVYHNEKPGNVPFPSWMKPSWHNCIMGCMLCQRACPVDRKLLDWIGEREDFSEEETGLFLRGVKPGDLPDTTAKKVERLSLMDDIERFPRNLGVFYRDGSS